MRPTPQNVRVAATFEVCARSIAICRAMPSPDVFPGAEMSRIAEMPWAPASF